MTAPRPEPQTEAGRRLLETHNHRSFEGDEPDAADNLWCLADDELWPCPFAQAILAIEAQARAPLVARMREAVLAMQPSRKTFAYRQGFDDAVLLVLKRLRALAATAPDAAPSTEPTRADVATVLSDAAAAIRKDGWTSGLDRPESGFDRVSDHRRTLLEALEWVWPWDGETPTAVLDLLRARAGTDDLWTWNAADGRTVADVLGLLAPEPTRTEETE